MIAEGEGHDCTISGLSITNGYSIDNGGGAIQYSRSGKLIIDDCIIDNNTAAKKGGAVYTANPYGMFEMQVEITNCTFTDNSAPNDKGGAVYALFCNSLKIDNSDFTDNSAHSGGCVYIGGSSYTVDEEIGRAHV